MVSEPEVSGVLPIASALGGRVTTTTKEHGKGHDRQQKTERAYHGVDHRRET
jgi:hypothetical protein